MPHTIQHETIRGIRHFLEPIQPPQDLRFSFRISFTSWSYTVLLLLLLLLTCHTSTLIFTTRKMQYAIVDDNVEDAPVYRCTGKALTPTRPCENHGLAIERVPTWLESYQKPQSKSFAIPTHGSLVKPSKIRGMQECT